MKISVIIPSFCPGLFFHDCLKSINEQTLDHSLYEVIVVLNGDLSSEYVSLVNNELALYDGLSVNFICTSVSGVSNARNIGISVAKGEYICFVDDDDLISNIYLSNLLSLANCRSIVVSNVLTFDSSIECLEPDYITYAYNKYKTYSKTRSKIKMRSFFSSSCCKLIPRDVIGDRRFDMSFKIGEDSLFMALISDRIEQVIFSDNAAVYYRRIRHTSVSHRHIPFFQRGFTALLISFSFFKIYIKNPFRYNFLFFLNRLLAPFHRLLK
ncbi:glycosyltransferase [Bacteroides sp.]|uniref:glycosyltransferase family 2 protein n=1 Tax=Bacteroides sp. TaxID=29523 RepID=UPI002FC95BD7